MKSNKKVLAIDIGASSGRGIIGAFDGSKLKLSEVHRFSNDTVNFNGTLYWDTFHQFHEIEQCLLKSRTIAEISSLSVDTWGADFGLLDKKGYLLESHVHYRDKRTADMIEAAQKIMQCDEIYNETASQISMYNTLFQLLSVKLKRPELLERADTMLMTPDLFNYFLTGEKHSEYTISSTSQLMDVQNHKWLFGLISKFGLPTNIFRDIVEPGTICGKLSASISDELGTGQIPVISGASHDTASAIAAVPVKGDDFAYISSGTWSILGTQLDSKVVSRRSMLEGFSNEGGCERKICYIRNITGLWLLQESRRQWKREGLDISFADIENEARTAKPFACFVDPDSDDFVAPGNIPKRIQEFCARTGQYVPQTRGEIARCVYESIVLKYKYLLNVLESETHKKFAALHIIGGGVRDSLLNTLTANACGRPVTAGPIEATSIGNVVVQLMTLGEISSFSQAKDIIANSFELSVYEPQDTEKWDEVLGYYTTKILDKTENLA